MKRQKVYLGHIIQIGRNADGAAYLQSWPKGQMVVSDGGAVLAVEQRTAPQSHWDITDFGDALIVPGFYDMHLHFPQLDMIGCHGEHLLGWLDRYTFPAELKFSSEDYAKEASLQFVNRLHQSGTVGGNIFGSSFLCANLKLIEACKQKKMKAIVGPVSMDRNAPEGLLIKSIGQHLDELDQIYEEVVASGADRLQFAVTPRFAPSCSDELMKALQSFSEKHRQSWLHTHFSESIAEINWIKDLYPRSTDYLDVYESFGLIHDRSLLAHCVWPTESEIERLARQKAKVIHCASSNLFLGSGLFKWSHLEGNIDFAAGSDVGAGTSFSLWHEMRDIYKIQKLNHRTLSVAELFAKVSCDGAKIFDAKADAYGLHVGSRADFQVVDFGQGSISQTQLESLQTSEDLLFHLIWIWQESMTKAVYVDGESVFVR
jgi:guanine deaminase